ncbi:hypothetical protein [Caulobacter segnis]
MTETKMMWASKFALSAKIVELPVRASRADDRYVYDARPGSGGWTIFTIGKDVHETREEAVCAAEAARTKKIASLRRQITKLEKLNFSAES